MLQESMAGGFAFQANVKELHNLFIQEFYGVFELGYWDHGFESRSRHGCLCLCCVGTGLCDGLITRPKESYQVSKIDYETSGVRRPRSLQGLQSH
jgi:hypothetical protein